jgi:hypothetical protein
MKKIFSIIFVLIFTFPVLGQEGFLFEKGINNAVIPFRFINNLIFIPIKVNGIELNFLLDSGVEETILFSMDDKKEVRFFNIEKITLRGLGEEESIEGLKSTNNTLEINKLKSSNHLLYIVLDQSFNLSSHIGIPVNGIIGYHFLKNNLVEINYDKKRITVYSDTDKNRKRIERKFQKVPLTIERLKPYVNSKVVMNSVEIPVKLLVDIGNSDAIWLFENNSKSIKVPAKNFEDYLGQGFSGDIEGKRAQISKFTMDGFEFNNLIIAFPDSTSIKNVQLVKDRSGSVGSEILRRFSVVLDYKNQKMYLRKNGDFYSPFSYNKSGVEIQHDGLQWVQETVRLETVPIIKSGDLALNENEAESNFKYKFVLKPIYLVGNVRKNSAAASSGLQKGDVIVRINNFPAYKYTLEEINLLLKSEEEKWITFEVSRQGQILTFKFQLRNVL